MIESVDKIVMNTLSILSGQSGTPFVGEGLYGKPISENVTNGDCKVMTLSNETGTGKVSAYKVFPGVELFYNDMHLAYCSQEQTTAKHIIEINHCREGRYECSFGENSCCYMAAGDLSIGSLMKKKSFSSFPLNHYHGITIVINPDELRPELCSILKLLSIDLERIQRYICVENRCCIMRANPSVEHIFSELYHVREERQSGYMKIKTLELLLFLSDLETREGLTQTDYYNQNQVKLIKEVAGFITGDLKKHHTIEQLSQKYQISATALKKCFRGVYGSSIYAYLRFYRLQVSQKLLEETRMSITEIAAEIGYENPNKFTSAFKSTYGVTPTDFKRGVRMDR